MTKPLSATLPGAAIFVIGESLFYGIAIIFQVEGFSQWLFQQAVSVVLLVTALGIVARYFTKRDEKKDAQLSSEREEHKENLKEQIKKADTALAQQIDVGKQSVEAIRLVNANLSRLADEFKEERERRHK